MKRILGLSVAALLVMAVVGGGTWAYFTDVETITGSTFSAGTLDLTVGGASGVLSATVSDVVPGQGETTPVSASCTLTQTGSISAELDIGITAVNNTGGTFGQYGDSVGDLGGELLVAAFLDVGAGGTWGTSDIGLKSDSTTYTYSAGIAGQNATGGTTTTLIDTVNLTQADNFYVGMIVEITSGPAAGEARLITASSQSGTSITVLTAFSTAPTALSVYTIPNLQYDDIDSYAGADWDRISGVAWATSPDDFVLLWRVPTAVGNTIQGDSVDFDIAFTLEQEAAD